MRRCKMETNLLFFSLGSSLPWAKLLAVESLKSCRKWRKKRQVVKREVSWESWPLVKGKMVCYFAVAGVWVWTLSFLGPSCKGKPFNKAGGLVFSIFFSSLWWPVWQHGTRNRVFFHAWLGLWVQNNGDLPCLLASSSQVHGRGAWFFHFFFPWATVGAKFLTCVCVCVCVCCSWNESGSGGLFSSFSICSVLHSCYLILTLDFLSQNQSNPTRFMLHIKQHQKGRQKLQHPVFPPSLLRQYWLGQHLFTYPDRTGWGAFRCVWP